MAPTNPIYDQMHANSVLMDTISDSYIKNVAFVSLRISLMSFFRTAKALNSYMNAISVRQDMTQTEKDRALGVVYAHEAYNAVFHFQNFMELVIKDISYSFSNDINVYKDKFVDVLKDLINDVDTGAVSAEYRFIKTHEMGIRAINKLRNDSVHSGVYILRSEALNELFGKHALPFMVEVSKLALFSGNRYWTFNLDNDNVHPIEDIIDEYRTNPTVNEYKIQLLKLIGAAAFDNEIFIKKKDLEEAQNDIMKVGIAATYGLLYKEKVEKAEQEAEKQSMLNQMDAQICPVCQKKTLVLEQDTYDSDDEGPYYHYTYDVHCTQCGFKIDHYLIGRIQDTGVAIEDYSAIHA